jgi:hypothetical protein
MMRTVVVKLDYVLLVDGDRIEAENGKKMRPVIIFGLM